MPFQSDHKELIINRYPKTDNRSLQGWNAADEHLAVFLKESDISSPSVAIYNDRFGFLSCHLSIYNPTIILTYKSQEKSIRLNLNANHISYSKDRFGFPLSPLPSMVDMGLIKIPKSLGLFRLFLYHITQSLSANGMVICAFMTRHFSPRLLTIAGEFFADVNQSKAWKKSRLLILKKKCVFKEISLLNFVPFNGNELQQYFGVFSANNIDHATQFLLDNLDIKQNEQRIMDLASGNGVIAYSIRQQHPDVELHLLDDFYLAIESAKLNLPEQNIFFHYNDGLDDIADNFFDLVVSNPPFHFEYETNIEVSVRLFHDVKRCLNKNGRFLIVASRHLNYSTHLSGIFGSTRVIAKNNKFEILECFK